MLIEFTNGAFRKHDLQKFWKFGRLHVRAFESRDDYLDLFPYLLKDPRRYPESAYQTSPPQDWLASHPKIIRNPTSRNIRLGTDRSGRKLSPAKEKVVDETQESRQSYHKGLKRCGQSTSICITLKSGKRSWLKLPIPYEEATALSGHYRDDKAYQFNDPAAIETLLKLSMRRSFKTICDSYEATNLALERLEKVNHADREAHLSAFIRDCCDLDLEPSTRVPTGDVYEAYLAWAKTLKVPPLFSHKMLTRCLKDRGVTNDGPRKNDIRFLYGICLNQAHSDTGDASSSRKKLKVKGKATQ